MNYQQKTWLWSVSPDNWNILKANNVWASSNNGKIRELIHPGDFVIFYVSGDMTINGIFEFDGDWYDATSPIWSDETNIVKYPSQIKIKKIVEGKLNIHNIANNLKIFETSEKSENGKLSRRQSLILKPGGSGFPANNAQPIPYSDFETILKQLKNNSSFFDDLSKKGMNKTHIQILEKFYILRRKIIEDSSEIRGIRGESPIPPDSIVDEPHYLHNLVRGVYKPSGDEFALSIQTNPNSKWGVEISFDDKNWSINYDFEDSEKYSSDIESLEKCFENDIPIGVIYKHKKGINEILGLGKIVNHQGTLFEIVNFTPNEDVHLEEKAEKYALIKLDKGDYSCPSLTASTIRRTKQEWFRKTLLEEYEHRCAFCGLTHDGYLKSSHIVPFAIMQEQDPKNSMNPSNGLLLCALCDIAFERGEISVNEEYEIIGNDNLNALSQTNQAIKSWITNIKDKLEIKQSSKFKPDQKFLKWKSELI